MKNQIKIYDDLKNNLKIISTNKKKKKEKIFKNYFFPENIILILIKIKFKIIQ